MLILPERERVGNGAHVRVAVRDDLQVGLRGAQAPGIRTEPKLWRLPLEGSVNLVDQLLLFPPCTAHGRAENVAAAERPPAVLRAAHTAVLLALSLVHHGSPGWLPSGSGCSSASLILHVASHHSRIGRRGRPPPAALNPYLSDAHVASFMVTSWPTPV